MPADDKTEPATPRRRKEAREKGQVARSGELSPAIMLFALFGTLWIAGSYCYRYLILIMKTSLSRVAEPRIDPEYVHSMFMSDMMLVLRTIAPFLIAGLLVAIIVNVLQVRFLFAPKLLLPKFERINPASGFKRIFSMRALFETAKSIMKIALVGYIAYGVFLANYPTMLGLMGNDNKTLIVAVGNIVYTLGMRVAVALIILAVIDYFFQRYQHEKGLRMTKHEIKEEMRQMEGSPEVRAFIKQRQRSIARQRMMAEVPQADVIITNPTQLAIAIKYERGMKAPKVLAKGERLIADRIREIARQHEIPIIEDKPLAQALFKTVDIGQEIPATLYKAVAEILAFVFRQGKAKRNWA